MDIMLDILKNLIQVKDAYAQMLDASKEKQDHIMQDNIQGLNAVLQKEQMLVRHIDTLESARRGLVFQLAQALNVPAEQLTVEAIAQRAQPPISDELHKAKTALADTLAQQMTINHTNQKLLETQLAYINFMLNAAARQPEVGDTYGAGGLERVEAPTHMGIIDQEI